MQNERHSKSARNSIPIRVGSVYEMAGLLAFDV